MANLKLKRAKDMVEIMVGNISVPMTVEEARELAYDLLQLGIEIEKIEDRVGEWIRIPMQYLAYHAKMGKKDAIIACWISNQTRSNAFILAEGLIGNLGWVIGEIAEYEEVEIEDVEDDPEMLQFYKQAVVDGEVIVIYHDDPDSLNESDD